MATVTRDQVATTSSAKREDGLGWLLFAASMLGLGGVFAVIDGIVALSKSKFFVADATYVFSDLRTWGWITLVVGIVALFASFAIMSGSEWARWFGIVVAGLYAIDQLLFVQAYPFWSLAMFSLSVLTIYALAVYGGKKAESY